MHLSLVIPAYNEEDRIRETLLRIQGYLGTQEYESEVIVVDDGSTDGTVALVASEFPSVRMISYNPNRGKGHAVKTGMLAATGDFRVFYDADGSTPIEEVEKLWPLFEEGAGVVIGSRTLPDSHVEVRQAIYRQTMGRIYNLFVRVFAFGGFPDTQCGFKGFTAEAVRVIFPRQTIERFSFDAELMYIARKHGFRIAQVGVRWLNSPSSRVNALVDSSRMFLDLITIRFKDLLGRYK